MKQKTTLDFPIYPASKISISRRKLVHGFGINNADYLTQPTFIGRRLRCPFYDRWKSMLERCYCPKLRAKHPSYTGCTVVNEWLTFSNFRAWMESQDWQGKQLDKDLLVQGNKVYGPDTCLFVNRDINTLLTDHSAARGNLPQGVSLDRGRYKAQCSFNGKQERLGSFGTPEEAAIAYRSHKYTHIQEVAAQQPEPIKSALLRYRIGGTNEITANSPR